MNKFKTTCLLLLITLGSLFSRSDSRYDKGLNLPFTPKAGDVNPQTGELSLSYSDITLPGRAGFNFSFGRIYSTMTANVFNMDYDQIGSRNVVNSANPTLKSNLGTGWLSNLPFITTETIYGSEVKQLFFRGSVYELETRNIHIPSENNSNIKYYDLLDMIVHLDRSVNNSTISINTNISDLNTNQSGSYVLKFKNNSRYYFNEDGQVLMHQDSTGLNQIWYFYNNRKQLSLVKDTIGREILFTYNAQGNLDKITWNIDRVELDAEENRVLRTNTHYVKYEYTEISPAAYPLTHSIKNSVYSDIAPDETFHILTAVSKGVMKGTAHSETDRTRYTYEEKSAPFSFMESGAVSKAHNAFLLLTGVEAVPFGSPDFLNKRVFEYEDSLEETSDLYRKNFFSGFMDHYKLRGQFLLNKNSNKNASAYSEEEKLQYVQYFYYKNGENGNLNTYSTMIQKGGMTNSYTYSLNPDKNKFNVLESLLVQGNSGSFKELTSYIYDSKKRKIKSVVSRDDYLYEESWFYDDRDNVIKNIDRNSVTREFTYDPVYNIPLEEKTSFTHNNQYFQYKVSKDINSLGQVTHEYMDLNGTQDTSLSPEKNRVRLNSREYDTYGNIIKEINAEGHSSHTVYDSNNLFPVKKYSQVTEKKWVDPHKWHITDPVDVPAQTIASHKVYNSDGSVWLEIDNNGYALEYFYDDPGTRIRVINPDEESSDKITITPATLFTNAESFISGNSSFLTGRKNNPGIRKKPDYVNDITLIITDVDRTSSGYLNQIKVIGKESDGIGNILKETVYRVMDITNEIFTPASIKEMAYDKWGRMITLTDPDKKDQDTPVIINGKTYTRYDKTWVITYDDLGRQIRVDYPADDNGISKYREMIYSDSDFTLTIIDPEKRTVIQTFDKSGNLIEYRSLGGPSTPVNKYKTYTYQYDPLNRKTLFTDAENQQTHYTYDERNLLVEQRYDNTGSDFFTYNALGQQTEKTDRKNQKIKYFYDEMGRNIKIQRYTADNSLEEEINQVFDKRGNPIWIRGNHLAELYNYDYGNRITSLSRYIRDFSGRKLDGTAHYNFNTDLAAYMDGQIIHTFHYNYDNAGNLKEMVYPDNSVHSYSYDNELTQLKDISYKINTQETTESFSMAHGFEYNNEGTVTHMKWGNGVTQDWKFENRKRISRMFIKNSAGSLMEDLKYSIDGSGNITSMGDNTYTYDGFNRLQSASVLKPEKTDFINLVKKHYGSDVSNIHLPSVPEFNPDADLNSDNKVNGLDHIKAAIAAMGAGYPYDEEEFVYSKNDNRIQLKQNGDIFNYTYGPGNRLESIYYTAKGSFVPRLYAEYLYDANGNTTKRTIYKNSIETKIIEFTYDTLNRVTETVEKYTNTTDTTKSTAKLTLYFYDNAGNRFIKQTEEAANFYFWHGQNAVAMDIEVYHSSQNDLYARRNTYVLSGNKITGRIITKIPTQSKPFIYEKNYYHLDHLNSVKMITDEAGKVIENYTYRAFAYQLQKDVTEDITDKRDYSFAGKELDQNSNLYYFNSRYYDAHSGRFINMAPVQDETNLYIYCSNNPLNRVDPTRINNTKYYGASYYTNIWISRY